MLSMRSAEICSVSELRRIAVYGSPSNAPKPLVEHLISVDRCSVRTTGLVLSVSCRGMVELGDPLAGDAVVRSGRTSSLRPSAIARNSSVGKRKLHTVSVRRRPSSLLGKRGVTKAAATTAAATSSSSSASSAFPRVMKTEATSNRATATASTPPIQCSRPDEKNKVQKCAGNPLRNRDSIRIIVEPPPPPSTSDPPSCFKVGDVVTVIGECAMKDEMPLICARSMHVVTGIDLTLWHEALMLRRKFLREELKWKEGSSGLGPPAPIE
mmetsp:Transcript_12599/g.27860  ORF Transcript_12599/g.27860 Transcript_12599/m.27860 type:complete len:268 (+) Transcript_12599:153-956(+)